MIWAASLPLIFIPSSSYMNPPRMIRSLILSLLLVNGFHVMAQHSVARQWNEVLLQAIRDDRARPTVHARNLFHTSVAMYDAWAAYNSVAEPFFLGNQWGHFYCPYGGMSFGGDPIAECEEAMSYANYHLIRHRFRFSPGQEKTWRKCDSLMNVLGYDPAVTSINYSTGDGAALGNYLAQSLIAFGLQDGSNEAEDYANLFYRPVNTPLDPDRWQPLVFGLFIDQSGVVSSDEQPEFLSPEWGSVTPFALKEEDLSVFSREGEEYWVYHDPGPPPYLNDPSGLYQWGFGLVTWWSAHLDPSDGVMWDVSPASIGNISELPEGPDAWRDFYDDFGGGDPSLGHDLNPVTGQPYTPNMVPRGDYTRVLAEFWADGPDSETPPGHWFTILNNVNDHPQLMRRFRGQGPELDRLEWDVKSYFILGGAMHDAAVSAWGIKGWYDYVRPISAIRYMASLGQRTDPTADNYHPQGFDLIPGFVETVEAGDPLERFPGQFTGRIKLKAWLGPTKITNPEVDQAGVGWMLARDWWPYQRPTFVTPPFAGYVSGHSTFSRAAAEVLTRITGDPFFPGGMGEFVAKKNEFLVFEEGPSVDVHLQWATYYDASNQTSLSRIWGGIHPPADDIPGRKIGIEVGNDAFEKALPYFDGRAEPTMDLPVVEVFPNPVASGELLHVQLRVAHAEIDIRLSDLSGREVYRVTHAAVSSNSFTSIPVGQLSSGIYLLQVIDGDGAKVVKVAIR